jgi:hypothetical protein
MHYKPQRKQSAVRPPRDEVYQILLLAFFNPSRLKAASKMTSSFPPSDKAT